jgi:hypothetical protein
MRASTAATSGVTTGSLSSTKWSCGVSPWCRGPRPSRLTRGTDRSAGPPGAGRGRGALAIARLTSLVVAPAFEASTDRGRAGDAPAEPGHGEC